MSFPYFKHSVGVASVVTTPASETPEAKVSLEPGGRVTSHLVKYSHHPDGRAHFSQDGLVRTEIKRQSIPIAEINGHVFTLYVQGLIGYKTEAGGMRPNTQERVSVDFASDGPMPAAIRFVGRIYPISWLKTRFPAGELRPLIDIETADKSIAPAVVWSAPLGKQSDDMCLVVTCHANPALNQKAASLFFIGGFDAPEVANDKTRPTSFLALSYPADNVEELLPKIGSIDWKIDDPSFLKK